MRVRGRTKLALAAGIVLAVCALTASAGTATGASAGVGLIPLAGTGSPQTGDFTPSGAHQVEFPAPADAATGPDPFSGSIVNRSLSTGNGKGAPANSTAKAKSNPAFNVGFWGLNFYPQRYA